MPLVVEEGRRCINNIQRSAALFLVKTTFSFLLAAAFLFLPYTYPYSPIQMTLVSALTIGAPSFLLTLEPNHNLVRGSFLSNVMRKALPGGISAALGVLLIMASRAVFSFPAEEISTMATLLMGAACFCSLWCVCVPFNRWRVVMFTVLAAAFCLVPIIPSPLRGLFNLTPLSPKELIVLAVLIVTVWSARFGLSRLVNKIMDKTEKSS